jgi:hypothetical protein
MLNAAVHFIVVNSDDAMSPSGSTGMTKYGNVNNLTPKGRPRVISKRASGRAHQLILRYQSIRLTTQKLKAEGLIGLSHGSRGGSRDPVYGIHGIPWSREVRAHGMCLVS